MLADRVRLVDPEHPDALSARANPAASYWSAGRTADAIAVFDKVLADFERLLGPAERGPAGEVVGGQHHARPGLRPPATDRRSKVQNPANRRPQGRHTRRVPR